MASATNIHSGDSHTLVSLLPLASDMLYVSILGLSQVCVSMCPSEPLPPLRVLPCTEPALF